ncbi:MAG: glycosyltransferase family 4 protein [Patescibacteria group bacterium]
MFIKNKEKYRVGFVGRLAADKGIEYLLRSIPFLEALGPKKAVFLLAGPKEVIGEEKYVAKIEKLIKKNNDRVFHLGPLSTNDLAYFYRNIDVLVLPSVNSTEAFGMVQVEAMLSGVPVVASDLPGIRVPVQKTGMGEVFIPKNPKSLAKKITKLLVNEQNYFRPKSKVQKLFALEKITNAYVEILNKRSK